MRQHLSIVDKHGNPFPAAAMSGDYELASTTRRLSNRGLSASGPNAALSRPLHVIRRSRVRSTIRNNPIASGMVDATVANLIWTDISPRWESISPQIKEALQQLWSNSQEELDYSETYDFYGQQEQVGIEVPPGKDVKFANPPDVGDNYKDFFKQELRAVARGLGITYEQISQDFEGVTFSSARIALNEYRRLIGMLQQRQ